MIAPSAVYVTSSDVSSSGVKMRRLAGMGFSVRPSTGALGSARVGPLPEGRGEVQRLALGHDQKRAATDDQAVVVLELIGEALVAAPGDGRDDVGCRRARIAAARPQRGGKGCRDQEPA